MSKLLDNYQKIQTQIRETTRPHRQPVQLLAVSKRHSLEAIKELYREGHRYFGENYAQELWAKAEELRDYDISWSYIGHLQSNKIKKTVKYASEIQTLASLKHAKLIDKEAASLGKTPYPVFIAVNAEGEEGKNGVSFEELPPLVERISSECPHLSLEGLMAIPPAKYRDSLQNIPPLYEKLYTTAQQVGKGRLSLGMTNDLQIAIEAGSTIVRIGTAIFGPRSKP